MNPGNRERSDASALAQFAVVAIAETFLDEGRQSQPQGFERNGVHDFTGKSLLQKHTRFGLRDASLLHVEECLVVDLSHGAAVTALDIIGVNLKNWLCPHACLVGAYKIGIAFLGIRALSLFTNQDTSCKSACRLLVYHIFIELAAGAVCSLMVDERVIVDMLTAIGDCASQESRGGMGTRKPDVCLVAA